MRYFLSIILALLISSNAFSQDNIKFVDVDPKLIHWLKLNVSPTTGLPLSFQIIKEKREEIHQRIGPADSLTAIIERLIVEEGVSIYDAALWQITLSALGGDNNINAASEVTNVFYGGSLRELKSIRSGYPNQPFIYDPEEPLAVSSDLKAFGKRGFIFRILNARGKYNTTDPLDGKARFDGFPTWPTVHWEDWKPIAGENAWVVIAAMHIYHRKFYDSRAGAYKHNLNAKELKLSEELARAAILLQAENGGIRMAPLGTYHHLLNIDNEDTVRGIQKQLDDHALSGTLVTPLQMFSDEGFDPDAVSEEFKWHYFEISTENNLSWYTALTMLYEVTGQEMYRAAMDGIEGYLKEVWSEESGYFHQGMHYTDGEWVSNTEYFATDCQTWGIAKLGPERIDRWFGEGAARRMWHGVKEISGVFDEDGDLLGVGFTREKNRISIEWTVGAIYAAQALAEYYGDARYAHDAATMHDELGGYRYVLSDREAAYSYSSKRDWIPFGWFSHESEVMSLVSTCWVVLLDGGFDPFRLERKQALEQAQLNDYPNVPLKRQEGPKGIFKYIDQRGRGVKPDTSF